MLNEDILAILRCPVTGQSLKLADAALVAKINQAIEAGKLQDKLGRLVEQPIGEGLVREDDQVLYPVRDGIPVMIADEGIALEQV